MKKIIFLFILLAAVYSLPLFAQHDQQSIAYPPPFLNVTPNGSHSSVVITNGFDNINLGVDFGEPYIATNPRNLANSICAFNINNLYYTLDGYNWTKNIPSFPGFSVIGDPVMTYDSLGSAYYAQLYRNGSTYGITVIRSTNGGVSWGPAYNVYSTNVGLSDKEWITADQTAGPYSNYVYVGWRQFGASGMRFSRSTDFGVTWSAPLIFAGGQGAYVCVGPNGNIQGGSVYFGCISGTTIYVNRSTDGGATFSPQVIAVIATDPGVYCAGRNTVKNCIRMDAFPRMAADNSFTSTRGNVYVAYCSNIPGPDNCEVFVVRSTDYGTTWQSPVRVNDDVTTTDQWMPSISVDNQTGKIFVCWYDSRVDVAGNLLTRLYGATSANGGVSFTANANISDVDHNPSNMAVGQPGGERYMGDYIGMSAMRNTGYAVWMDGRNNNLGSYVAYYPDFAMTVNTNQANMSNNDSAAFTVKVPALKGPFTENIKFTASVDTLPQSGTIEISFVNGRDTITSVPDSVRIRVRTIGTITPARQYRMNIKGKGSLSGTPVHIRTVDLLVNSSRIFVGTNRNNICDFKVNGVQYNTQQQFVFPNASTLTVQALSPKIVGFNRYVYVNWSDNGDTTHTVTVNGNLTLTANYKIQYRLAINSTPGNTYGGNDYFDSSATRTFGVLSRYVFYNGGWYQFAGWNGNGNGSYTSPDSTGNDTVASVTMNNPIVETARWVVPIGIKTIGSEIPKVYALYQNFPNPFNPNTTINFDLPKGSDVKIIIYDLLGREVEMLVNQRLDAGKYSLDFDAAKYASGVYFYRITAGDYVSIKKMMIVK